MQFLTRKFTHSSKCACRLSFQARNRLSTNYRLRIIPLASLSTISSCSLSLPNHRHFRNGYNHSALQYRYLTGSNTSLNEVEKARLYLRSNPDPSHRIYRRVSRDSFLKDLWIERLLVALMIASVAVPLYFLYYYFDGTVPYTNRKRFLILPLWIDDIVGYYTLQSLQIDVGDKNETDETTESNAIEEDKTNLKSIPKIDETETKQLLKILNSKDDYRVAYIENLFFHILESNFVKNKSDKVTIDSVDDADANANADNRNKDSKLSLSVTKNIESVTKENLPLHTYQSMQINIPKKLLQRFQTGFDWKLYIVDEPQNINAMCAPGGKMLVYTGLLKQVVESDEDCAAILCHEIAHALCRHGCENIQFTLFLIATIYLGSSSMGIDISWLMEKMLTFGIYLMFRLPMSRKYELEADNVAIYLMINAGYDPWALVGVMEKLDKLQKTMMIHPPELLSTHPLTDKRAEELKKRLLEILPHTPTIDDLEPAV